MITVKSIHSVLIDGEHIGNLVEAVRNWPNISPVELQDAYVVYDNLQTATLKAVQTELTNLKDKVASIKADVLAAVIAGNSAAIHAIAADVIQSDRMRLKREAQDEVERAQAALDALN